MIVALIVTIVILVASAVFAIYAHEVSYHTPRIPETDVELRVRQIKSRLGQMYKSYDTMYKKD